MIILPSWKAVRYPSFQENFLPSWKAMHHPSFQEGHISSSSAINFFFFFLFATANAPVYKNACCGRAEKSVMFAGRLEGIDAASLDAWMRKRTPVPYVHMIKKTAKR